MRFHSEHAELYLLSFEVCLQLWSYVTQDQGLHGATTQQGSQMDQQAYCC